MEKLLAYISGVPLGDFPKLNKKQLQEIWDNIDPMLTGKSARVGRGSSQQWQYECRNPQGGYFEFHYYDNNKMEIISGSHW